MDPNSTVLKQEQGTSNKESNLPPQLEKVKRAETFPSERHRWNTNEEVASILVAFSKHAQWQKNEVAERPPSGSLFLYNRKEMRYRRDGYCWKKRKDGKTAREDHMKLKVHGSECIYGSYVHSAILPTFHRRCYWLLQNADIVLVHYLNVPLTDDNKLGMPTLSLGADNKNWSEHELQLQLRPMFASMKHFDPSIVTEQLMEETINHMVIQLMSKQNKKDSMVTHNCTCPGHPATCMGTCRGNRIICPKVGEQSSVQSRLISYIQQSQKAANHLSTDTMSTTATHMQQSLTASQEGSRVHNAQHSVLAQRPVVVNTMSGKQPQVTANVAAQGQLPGHSPLILNLSQLPGSNGLIILSSQTANPISIINGNAAAPQNTAVPSSSASLTPSSTAAPLSQNATVANNQQPPGTCGLQSQLISKVQTQSLLGNFQHNQKNVQGLKTTPCGSNGNLQTAFTGSQPQAAMDSSISTPNCDTAIKSEESTMISTRQTRNSSGIDTNPLQSSALPGFEGTSLLDSQAMETSLDILESTLFELGDEPGKSETGTSGQPGANMLAPVHTDFGNNLVPQSQKTLDVTTDQILTSLSPNCLESLRTSISSTVDNDLDLEDLLDLPEFDATFPALAKCSTPTLVTSKGPVVSNIASESENKDASVKDNNSGFLPELQNITFTPQPTAEVKTPDATTASSSGSCANCSNSQTRPDYSRAGIAKVTDLAPDWGFSNGGTKVLVTGPWYSSTSPYTVYFNDIGVPATLVQSGVLRCYAPEHNDGPVKLQVACEGYIISDPHEFEYKVPPEQKTKQDPFCLKESELKSSIVAKLQDLETHLVSVPWADKCAPNIQIKCSQAMGTPGFENALVECCRVLSHGVWARGNDLIRPGPLRLTLLHLAAALGYTSMINELIKWRFKSPCLLLQFEVDALSRDDNACTPLMWACALGHHDAILLLYQWIPAALQISNKNGHCPLTLATSRGHHHIVQQIQQMEATRKKQIENVVNKHLSEKKMTPQSQETLLPGDASQALAVIRFAKPSIPVRHTQQQKGKGSNSSGRMMGTTVQGLPSSMSHPQGRSPFMGNLPPASPGNMGNLQIEIPPAQPPYIIQHKNLKPFNSAQNTPKGGSCVTVAGTNVNFGGVLANSEAVNIQNAAQPSRRTRLMKRTSVEVLPDFPLAEVADSSKCTRKEPGTSMQQEIFHQELTQVPAGLPPPGPAVTPSTNSLAHLRSASSDPHISGFTADDTGSSSATEINRHELHGRSQSCADPMISMCDRDLNSPLMFLQTEGQQGGNQTGLTLEQIHRETFAMETDSPRTGSPPGCMNQLSAEIASSRQSEGDCENLQQDHQMITLANQIIAAIPERIKFSPGPGEEMLAEEMLSSNDRRSSYSSYSSSSSIATPPGVAEDSGISTPLEGMALEDCRYPDLSTPASSLSPASSCLHSPYRCFSMDSPPPTTAEFTEYFNAPSFYLEKDFSQLTLTDEEQRRLYEAAQIIQNFYRRYKDKKELQQRQQQKEMEAAILIQSYYRRYKQYLYYKKMTQAAVLIQSQFRSYYAQKRFRKSREAATIIQNRYRAYKEHERFKKSHSAMIQQRFRCHYQRKREGSLTDKVDELMEDTELDLQDEDIEKTQGRSSEEDHRPGNNSKNNSSCGSVEQTITEDRHHIATHSSSSELSTGLPDT